MVVERNKISDMRGYLERIYCSSELKDAGWHGLISQINHTVTKEMGTIRGLHYQKPPHAEMKLITCLNGAIWDVAVDLREGSPTFLRWHAEMLSEENNRALLLPKGFAHGFQTLSDNCELIYLHSSPYMVEYEGGIRYDDPKINIQWPLHISQVSPRDQSHAWLGNSFGGVKP